MILTYRLTLPPTRARGEKIGLKFPYINTITHRVIGSTEQVGGYDLRTVYWVTVPLP